jgi:acetoin utilization protein AcuB
MAGARTVSDVMTRTVVTVSEEDNLLEVRGRLAQHSFHHLPVLDGTRVVGLLSQRDVLRATVSGVDGGAFALAREQRFLEQTFVRDLMRAPVVTAAPDDSLPTVAARMLEHRIGALPVTDVSRNLLGIITENDLVRTIAEGR